MGGSRSLRPVASVSVVAILCLAVVSLSTSATAEAGRVAYDSPDANKPLSELILTSTPSQHEISSGLDAFGKAAEPSAYGGLVVTDDEVV